jgi:large subunit ribosomal protein L31e
MRAAPLPPSDVRVDPLVNKFLFSKGVRSVPHRVRVRLSRKRNDDEDAEQKVRALGGMVTLFVQEH